MSDWSVEYATSVKEYARETTDGSIEDSIAKAQALECVDHIIESGVLGEPDAEYRVRVMGHANPQNITPAGAPSDYVQITVTRVEDTVEEVVVPT